LKRVGRRALVAVLCALVLAPGAAGTAPPGARLDEQAALALVKAEPKVADWIRRYPADDLVTEGKLDETTKRWTVRLWAGEAGQIVEATVTDDPPAVTEAWTGPQVAWRMARGYDGSFGGRRLEEPWLWFGFCALFLVGLADWRRPLSLRNLDLVALLFPVASLWFFNEGRIFTSVPLMYPAFAYLLARGLWIGLRPRRPSPSRPVWPVWLLAAAAALFGGIKIGLNVQESNVIDVGYSGVIGAHRIVEGQAPYGNFPREGDLEPCGKGDSSGQTRDRIQTNGRCESANERGDTYGPVAYLAYVPAFLVWGWTGKWDLAHGGNWPDLPAVHATTMLFDLLCLVGLALVGLRFGGARFAATLAFAWSTYPFVLYAGMTNTNDLIPPALLIWGFWLVTSPWARGAFAALAGWAKFAAFVVAPLWASYPERRLRPTLSFVHGFLVASVAALAVLALEPDLFHAARVFAERTVAWQVGRDAPFSLWGWGQYRAAGIPDLHVVQLVLQALLVLGALALAWWPRRKSPLQLAALSCALLVGFEAVLTYWFYSYIPWYFPFAAVALLAPAAAPVRVAVEEPSERKLAGLVAAR
jgi:hypothetical protein